jgi:hypothetical protein
MENKGYRRPQDTHGLDYEASPHKPKAKPVDRKKQSLVSKWQPFVAATEPPSIIPLPTIPSMMVAAVKMEVPTTVIPPPSIAVVQQLAAGVTQDYRNAFRGVPSPLPIRT